MSEYYRLMDELIREHNRVINSGTPKTRYSEYKQTVLRYLKEKLKG